MSAWDRTPLKVEHLKEVVANPAGDRKSKKDGQEVLNKKKKKAWLMSDAQAREIIIGTILAFYEEFQESADNFKFISSAEKIDTRLNLTINLHKRFNLREDAPQAMEALPDAPEDDDSSASGSASGDENKEDRSDGDWGGEAI